MCLQNCWTLGRKIMSILGASPPLTTTEVVSVEEVIQGVLCGKLPLRVLDRPVIWL